MVPQDTIPTHSRCEQDGVIHLSVMSDGKSGREWIEYLEDNGLCVMKHAKSVLYSSDFRPTKGVTTNVAILKGSLFERSNRTIKSINAYAIERKLTAPNAEIACLIYLKFTDEEIKAMGLNWIVVMHKFINDFDGGPRLLGAYCGDVYSLISCYESSDRTWDHNVGFAFAVSQVGPQN